MNKTELLDIFTRQQRIELDFPDVIREVDGTVIRHISLTSEDGFVIYSHLNEDSADAAISAQIARFQSIPQNFEWKLYDYDPPKDLLERLRRRGFEIGDPEALLVLDLTAGPETLNRRVPSSVVRITDPSEIDAVVALENIVWETDRYDLGERLKRELREHPDLLSVYISYAEQQPAAADALPASADALPAAAAWINFHVGTSFASLWGGSTLPQFRNQGHYSLLLAARAQEARARGFSLLTVDASPMSRPILEKHGFQHLATTMPCTWTAQVSA
jgi:GNAT superfamily N-acetyltransferase